MATKFVTPRFGTSQGYVSPHYDGEMITGDSMDPEFYNASGCGIRPACSVTPLFWTKTCKAQTDQWQKCVAANSAAKIAGKYGAGSTAPSEVPYTPPTSSGPMASSKGMSTGAIIAIVGSLAVIGVGAYFLLRK